MIFPTFSNIKFLYFKKKFQFFHIFLGFFPFCDQYYYMTGYLNGSLHFVKPQISNCTIARNCQILAIWLVETGVVRPPGRQENTGSNPSLDAFLHLEVCLCARPGLQRSKDRLALGALFYLFLRNFHLNCFFFNFNREEVKNCCKIREKCFLIYCSPGSMFSCLTRGADLAVLGLL